MRVTEYYDAEGNYTGRSESYTPAPPEPSPRSSLLDELTELVEVAAELTWETGKVVGKHVGGMAEGARITANGMAEGVCLAVRKYWPF